MVLQVLEQSLKDMCKLSSSALRVLINKTLISYMTKGEGENMKKILLILPFILALIALNLGFSTAYGAAPFIKESKMNGIHYVSGGVGLGERKALKKMAKDYDLKLVFAMHSGEYLSGVTVVINDPSGKRLFETVSNGPWLLADLPQGKYEITASYKDRKKVRKVKISEGLQTVMFHWKP